MFSFAICYPMPTSYAPFAESVTGMNFYRIGYRQEFLRLSPCNFFLNMAQYFHAQTTRNNVGEFIKRILFF